MIKSNSSLGGNCYLECHTPLNIHWDFIDIGRVVNNTSTLIDKQKEFDLMLHIVPT